MNKIGKILNTIIYSLVVTLFSLSFAIAIPLFWRGFYYLHIDAYNLVEVTGVSKSDLIYSFNDLMDSLMFFKTPFSEGVFPFSESGKSHFLDCQVLFVLDYIILIISTVLLVIYLILLRKNRNLIYRPFNISPAIFMMLVPVILLGALGCYALIDLNGAYTFFHKVFFPGKDNWVFNSHTDPIIKALPEGFFVNCGILILSVYLIIFIGILVYSLIRKRKLGKNKIYYSRRKNHAIY